MPRLSLLCAVLLLSGCALLGDGRPRPGAIVETATGRSVGEAGLMAAARGADFVLLGEKHDNPAHHALQARVVSGLAGASPPLEAVVFEMMTTDQQAAIVGYLKDRPGDAGGLGPALDWKLSGWPDWALYRPIAAAALEGGAEIVAGNLTGAEVKGALRDGLGALPAGLVHRTGLDTPLQPRLQADLLDELVEAHCGYLKADQLGGMALVQRARDARMADRMATLAGRGRAVLIAGAGHVRLDRGVPIYLARLAPGRRILSIGFVEAGEEGLDRDPSTLPYDYAWLTPSSDPEGFDACAAFRGELERIRHRPPPARAQTAGLDREGAPPAGGREAYPASISEGR
ncbi:MAG: ChaN family lipoprotein [Geminicoccaceae bacterium]|nr:ChaN family lipoprotein [Geminicoccaceae bacterium]